MAVKILSYHALEPGTALTVLGAVHGNERCGTEAITHLVADIDNGNVVLKRGTLQLVPIANPKAYLQGVRFVERNLNRQLYPKEIRSFYEDHLDPILCGLLDKSDVLLDLHSYRSQGGPFIFLSGQNALEIAYAKSLGVADFVCGWSEAFGDANSGKESQGTTEYARTKGALAVTLECGHHHNTDAAQIGYNAILRAMAHWDMLDLYCSAALGLERNTPRIKPRCVRMKSVFRRQEGAVLAKSWKHFAFVEKGEVMAKLASGEELAAPEAGFIVLPKEDAGTGEEWFYFGAQSVLLG
ncbi:MAG: succinylglutamate desuccinylase/aspartoacylase family protein [Burkholderiales bacterium]